MATRSPFFNAQSSERQRDAIHFPIQILVGQYPFVAWLTFPNDRCLGTPPCLEVSIDTIDRRVQLAADETT
jgi:hypothetical protein